MNRDIDQPAFGAPPPRRTRASRALYWVVAIAIALVSIRLCLWFLARAGLIAEDDANLMLVVAVPIALLTIGKMAHHEPIGDKPSIFVVNAEYHSFV